MKTFAVLLLSLLGAASCRVLLQKEVPDWHPDPHPVDGTWQDTCVLTDKNGVVKSKTYGTCFDCYKMGATTGAYKMEWHGGSWADFVKSNWLDVCNYELVDTTVPSVPAKANRVPDWFPSTDPIKGNWQDTCVLKNNKGAVMSTTYGTCYDCHKMGGATGAYTMEWHGGSWSDFAKTNWLVVCDTVIIPDVPAPVKPVPTPTVPAPKVPVPAPTVPATSGNVMPDLYPDEHPVAGNWQDKCVLKDAAGVVKSTTYGTCFDCAKAGLSTGAYKMEWHGGSWTNLAGYAWDVVCGDWENMANRG